MIARPPRPIEWLVQRLLDDESRETVTGDLAEAYVAVRAAHGPLRAAAFYAREALRSVIACRITATRRAPERRLDFDAAPRASLRDLLKPALRQFRDQPLYAGACTGTLALALAAACASVAVVKRALFDPLPYAGDHEIVSLVTANDGPMSAVSPHVLADLRAGAPPLTTFAPIRPAGVAVAGPDGTAPVGANLVTRDYFTLLGVQPAIGRTWQDAEPHAVVISWQFWEQTLAADPQALGRVLTIDGQPRTIVGILPARFVPPYWPRTAIWMPLDITPLLADVRVRRSLSILARRASGYSQADVDAYLARFSEGLRQQHPTAHGRQAWRAIPLRDELVGPARAALVATTAGAVLLLIIVGANIAGLSAAHALATRHQLAVRAALGATRGRLFVEQLVDSLTLAAVGSAGGLALAYALVALAARYQQYFLDRLAPISLDAPTIVLGLAAGVAVGVVAALLPRGVLHAMRPEDSLRARGVAGDVRVTAARTGLVVAQVALALVLLVQAGLLIRTVRYLADMPLGFDHRGLTTFSVNLPGSKYAAPAAQIQFERAVMERLSQIRGVSSVSASVGVPIIGGMGVAMVLREQPADAGRTEIAYFSVSPEFMGSLGARIVAGRDLHASDTLTSTPVVVINETMARQLWPGGDAIGAQVQIGAGDPGQPWITVVGIVADLRQHGPTEAVRPTAFGSTHQFSWARRYFTVRTPGERPPVLATEMRAAVAAVDPAIAVGAVTPIEQLIDERTARHTLVTLALAIFGGVALLLCLSGLYAVVALTSRSRMREYAIRLALGARRGGVRWLVMRQGIGLAVLGTVLGLLVAGAGARAVTGLLHGVPPLDPMTYGAAACALLALASLAALQPARRAERVDPTETLRAE